MAEDDHSPDADRMALEHALEAAQRQKLPCGLHVQTASDAQRRIAEGWQFIAVASELKMMLEVANTISRQVNPERAAGDLAKY